MAERFHCYNCEKTEDKCECSKYCAICMGEDRTRLCEDGQYYCEACREACDYKPSA